MTEKASGGSVFAVVGDTHIPDRVDGLHPNLKKLLGGDQPGKDPGHRRYQPKIRFRGIGGNRTAPCRPGKPGLELESFAADGGDRADTRVDAGTASRAWRVGALLSGQGRSHRARIPAGALPEIPHRKIPGSGWLPFRTQPLSGKHPTGWKIILQSRIRVPGWKKRIFLHPLAPSGSMKPGKSRAGSSHWKVTGSKTRDGRKSTMYCPDESATRYRN